MATFLSTAFLQQCFAMHRHDLVVKRLTQSGVVVTCKQCKIRHAVRLGSSSGAAPGSADSPAPLVDERLAACVTDHLAAVCVQTVDVQRDCLELACRQCRTTHAFRIIECVTRAMTSSSGLSP